jgi:hypothetical protein
MILFNLSHNAMGTRACHPHATHTHTSLSHTHTERQDCPAVRGNIWPTRGGGGAEGAHGSRQAAHVDGVAGRGQRRRARSCGLWRTLRGLHL